MTFDKSGVATGVVWFTRLISERLVPDGFPGESLSILEMHICARPDVKGRWLSRSNMAFMFDAVLDKADAIVAFESDPKRKRMLSRLGFTTNKGSVNILPFIED